MNFVTVFMLGFSILGALDYILGNKLGLGSEFEKGYRLLGTMAITMLGMLVIAPAIGQFLLPFFNIVYNALKIDPSLIPTLLFANDMGGASLGISLAENEAIGAFNSYIVASMMGATISFTLPYALGSTKPNIQKHILLGFLCGIITIPIGCFVAGIILRIKLIVLLLDIFPLIIFSIIIACGIIFFPMLSVKIFGALGWFIKNLIIFGLVVGTVEFLTGIELIKGIAMLDDSVVICLNASAVMSGAFPIMLILSKLLKKPISVMGKKLGINEASSFGFVSTLATNVTTFDKMSEMDDKGIVMNSAFAVSANSVFAAHLAFTLAFNSNYILPMIVGKLVSGFSALLLSVFVYKKSYKA